LVTEDRLNYAKENQVQLINGLEFVEMLIKAGINDLDKAF
jgi:hypothetical protein